MPKLPSVYLASIGGPAKISGFRGYISNFYERPEMTQLNASGQDGTGLRIGRWSEVKDEKPMLWVTPSEDNLLVKNKPPASPPAILLS